MTALSTDYFTKIAQPGAATSLAAPGHTIGGTSISVDSTSLWVTTTGVIFAIDTVTISSGGTEVRDANSYTVWEAVVSSATTITSMVLLYGTDQNYPAGSTTRVYQLPTASRENRTVDGLLIAHNPDGTLKANAITAASQITDGIIGDAEMATAVKPVTLFNENTFDHVVSGCVWTADAAGSTRLASMTAGVVMLAGKRLTVAAVTSRTFTASKDVYVDFSDNGDGTVLPVYTDGTTNAASGALAAGSLRNAIIVVGAGNIAAAASINQGQETSVLPIASSIPYAVTDSLGNLICPRDPNRKVLGYRQATSTFSTTSGTAVQITGLSCPVIVPTGRKIRITVNNQRANNNSSTQNVLCSIWDGTVGSGTQLQEAVNTSATASGNTPASPVAVTTPASASKTYGAGLATSSASTGNTNASATAPVSILVELA